MPDQQANVIALATALAQLLASQPVAPEPAPSLPQVVDDSPALMSIPDAAKVLGLSRSSAYRYANSGELPTKRIGGRVYVVRAQLADFLATDSTQENPAA
ncbi:helix-turn-helix domain-containing protein [Kutzneria chonburiensis]|uniref:Helix-turn-helix domain-containing protein n=1 Tax=Kutzneria chonburiensis TaxID=1483604 RepID=A0ABV6MLD3_9PSEU|nr:helix-turn-helix domain-containing protein [Kutzneria chonburiensis]